MENSGNLEKNHVNQSLAKILTEIFLFWVFSWFFLNSPGGYIIWNLEKNPVQLHCQTFITLVVTQYVKYEILDG